MDTELSNLPSPFQTGALDLGAAAEEGANDDKSYGGENVDTGQDPADQMLSTPNPEEPNLIATKKVGVFGGPEDVNNFSNGGSPRLPDGNINPENFVRVRESLVRDGTLKIGQSFRIMNPATKKMVPVIVRGIKPDSEEGPAIDVAPHVALELGGTSSLIFDPRPVKGFPVAQYSTPYRPSSQSAVNPKEESVEPSGAGLSGIGAPSFGPGQLRNASALDSESPGPTASQPEAAPVSIVSKNKDGSVTLSNGETRYRDGTKSVTHGNRQFFYKRDQKTGDWELFDKVDNAPGREQITTVEGVPHVMRDGKLVRVPIEGESLEEIPSDVTGEGAIKELSPSDQAAVRAFASYSRQPPTAGRVNPTYNRLEKYIFAYRPDYGGSLGFGQAKQVENEFASSRTAVAGGQIISANTSMRHLSKLTDVVDKLDNSKVRLANGLINYLKTATGDPNVMEFNRTRDTLVGEFQKMITGGVPYSEDVRRGIDNINAANSPEQLKAVIKEMAGLMSDKLSELGFRYESVFKKPYKGLVNPDVKGIAKRLGVDNFAQTESTSQETPAAPETPTPNDAKMEAQRIIATSSDPAEIEKAQKVLRIIQGLQ